DVARQVQLSMLPKAISPGLNQSVITGTLRPALEVGGDFFDFFYADSDHLCFVVGDVSDKGAASGLFMAASKTLIKVHATRSKSPAEIVTNVNRELSLNNDSCMFVTLFLGVLNLDDGRVLFTNAGHNPPMRITEPGDVSLVTDRNGHAVGVDENAEYGESSFVLGEGETFFAYTDGVTEATNSDDEMFGEKRLVELLAFDKQPTAERAVASVSKAVEEFESGTQQSDDITIIALTFLKRAVVEE
ncbi:MAG: sigma-B regulation protein RsbU (phosphoserine phosphatase), partial [Planctomycetota bacterium]